MSVQSKHIKYCHSCQAQLPIAAKVCPYCRQHQLSAFEIGLNRIMQTFLPQKAPATVSLLVAIITYFIVICVDIALTPGTNLQEILLAPPGNIIYHWGAHLRGETVWWRLITANFIHFGLLHIVFNAIALRYTGPYVERAFGPALTFVSFIVLGTGSMLCSNIFGSSGLVCGASGGIMALIGMAAASAHREHTALSLEIRNTMIKWFAYTLGFGLLMTYTGGMGIDNIAHISGFILGVCSGFAMPQQSTTGYTKRWIIRTARFALFLTLIAVSAAFTRMVFTNQSSKFQSECITSLKVKAYDKAEISCAMAYKKDKTKTVSYHNYIYLNIVRGNYKKADELCHEGMRKFAYKSDDNKPTFADMCQVFIKDNQR